jgi:colanic acid biosynthesis glycosyl transferase WcaI
VIVWNAIRLRPQIIFVVEPPLFAAPAARLAALLSGSKAWLHVQDFEVDAAFGLGLLRGRKLKKVVAAFEGWLMRRFDRVSTISNRMVDRLSAKSVPVERTQLFANWVDLDRIYPLPHMAPLRRQTFDDDRIVVLYSGSMGKKHGLDTVVEAARLLDDCSEPRIHFLFCGDEMGRQELEASTRGARNVSIWPLVGVERLNELLNLADIHVLPQRADAEDLVFPSKLTNMLASGRPVVATTNQNTQIADTLRGCGVVVPPGDAQALAGALRSLAEDPARRRKLGKMARLVAERLWDKDEVLANAFAEHFAPQPQPAPTMPARANLPGKAKVIELPAAVSATAAMQPALVSLQVRKIGAAAEHERLARNA